MLIAGGLPPLNGTYRPDRVRAFDTNLEEYRRLVELQAPHVDLFLCETMSTGEEALSAAKAAAETGKPVWVSWCLQDRSSRLRSGETIEEAAAMLDRLPIAAVLANCSSHESIGPAIADLVATGLLAGGYANAFAFIPLDYTPGKTREQLVTRPGSRARGLCPAGDGLGGRRRTDRGRLLRGRTGAYRRASRLSPAGRVPPDLAPQRVGRTLSGRLITRASSAPVLVRPIWASVYADLLDERRSEAVRTRRARSSAGEEEGSAQHREGGQTPAPSRYPRRSAAAVEDDGAVTRQGAPDPGESRDRGGRRLELATAVVRHPDGVAAEGGDLQRLSADRMPLTTSRPFQRSRRA